jgi:hypothetical protein
MGRKTQNDEAVVMNKLNKSGPKFNIFFTLLCNSLHLERSIYVICQRGIMLMLLLLEEA